MRSFPSLVALVLLGGSLGGCDPAATPVQPEPSDARRIINGTPTGSDFGNVGALLYDFDGNGKVDGQEQLCTGSLISETVFLTAAHCVAWLPAGAQFHVSFEPDLMVDQLGAIAATEYHYDPQYGRDMADLHDLAVVILPAAKTRGITPLKLPPAGYLDQLAAKGGLVNQLFTNVGYGTSGSRTGQPYFDYDGLRKHSRSEYMGLQPNWLGLLMNSNATGEGGDCYGDSGGPKFLDGNRETIVATVTTGDVPCRATSWDYRLDTPSARAFLGRFVPLP